MPSSVINRKTVREALAALIVADFNSDWNVYAFNTNATFEKARNIVVTSGGSGRNIMGADTEETDTSFRFRIVVFIKYADDANSWTAQNSEDALDLAEKDLTDLLTDNQSGANWNRLYILGESDPDLIVELGGTVYRREIITVRTEIYT